MARAIKLKQCNATLLNNFDFSILRKIICFSTLPKSSKLSKELRDELHLFPELPVVKQNGKRNWHAKLDF